MTMPERIWIGPPGNRYWANAQGDSGETEYLRADLLAAKDARIAELEAALERIAGWANAYPVAVFQAPTEAEEKACVEAMESAVKHGSSKMHASWARHILDGIAGICRTATEGESA